MTPSHQAPSNLSSIIAPHYYSPKVVQSFLATMDPPLAQTILSSPMLMSLFWMPIIMHIHLWRHLRHSLNFFDKISFLYCAQEFLSIIFMTCYQLFHLILNLRNNCDLKITDHFGFQNAVKFYFFSITTKVFY